jgi:NDP-sugar pyrophosphorylase family protein
MSLPVIILAGGLGTRVAKSFKNIQKCMIKFNRKPFLYYVLKNLEKNKITKVILSLGYNAHQVENYIKKNNDNFNLNFFFSYDGQKPLGTGGAVKKAVKFVQDDFLLTYGDTYLNYNFEKIVTFYKKKKTKSLISVYKNKNGSDKNNIFFNGKKICYYSKVNREKCNYIDWGLSVFNKDIFLNEKKSIFDMNLIYNKQIEKNQLYGFEVFKRYIEIGSLQAIRNFKLFLNEKK